MSIRAYAAAGPKSELSPREIEPAELEPHEIEVEVACVGLCHSDLHLIDDAWGTSRYPLVPGHEIVGRVTRCDPSVSSLRLGQRVGVGWQRSACLRCRFCLRGQENLCSEQTATCGQRPGGFADRVRVDGRFAFPIPDGLSSPLAAPLLCGGVTVFSPLQRYQVGAGSTVGVIGVGGLGHLTILIAKAMGAEVVAFTSSPGKRDELLAAGASAVADSTDPREIRKHLGRLDLVLSTVHVRLDWITYLQTLRPGGTLCFLGAFPGLLQIPPAVLLEGQRSITGSTIGGRATMLDLLDLAARHHITPQVQVLPLEQVNQAIGMLRRNEARYRIVLTP